MGYLALPAHVHADIVPKCFQMVQLHVQLQDHYAGTDLQIFNLTSKTHFCLHTMLLSNSIHPYLTWCFKGETKMKTVQRLWKSCLVGNKHWAVAQIAAIKNRHLQTLKHQRWNKRLQSPAAIFTWEWDAKVGLKLLSISWCFTCFLLHFDFTFDIYEGYLHGLHEINFRLWSVNFTWARSFPWPYPPKTSVCCQNSCFFVTQLLYHILD